MKYVLAISIGILTTLTAYKYIECSNPQYFYVYDSIVYPAGTDYDLARKMSQNAHLGVKRQCEIISSRDFR